jgi:hypothetical protein
VRRGKQQKVSKGEVTNTRVDTHKVIKCRQSGRVKVLRPLKRPVVRTYGLVGQVINGAIAQQNTPRIVPVGVGGSTVPTKTL